MLASVFLATGVAVNMLATEEIKHSHLKIKQEVIYGKLPDKVLPHLIWHAEEVSTDLDAATT